MATAASGQAGAPVYPHTHRPETAHTHAPPGPQGGREPWGSPAGREMEALFAPRGARGQGRPGRPGEAEARSAGGGGWLGRRSREAPTGRAGSGLRPEPGAAFPRRPHRARGCARGCGRRPAALGPVPNPEHRTSPPNGGVSAPQAHARGWPQCGEAGRQGRAEDGGLSGAVVGQRSQGARAGLPFRRGWRWAERAAAGAGGAGSTPRGARRFAAPGPGPGLREPHSPAAAAAAAPTCPPPGPQPRAQGLAGRWRRRWRSAEGARAAVQAAGAPGPRRRQTGGEDPEAAGWAPEPGLSGDAAKEKVRPGPGGLAGAAPSPTGLAANGRRRVLAGPRVRAAAAGGGGPAGSLQPEAPAPGGPRGLPSRAGAPSAARGTRWECTSRPQFRAQENVSILLPERLRPSRLRLRRLAPGSRWAPARAPSSAPSGSGSPSSAPGRRTPKAVL